MSSRSHFEFCISLLRENDKDVENEAKRILTKMCDNIIKNPKDVKYRKIRIENAIVETKLLPAIGAIECLFAAGFIENDDGFLLPMDATLAGIIELKNILTDKNELVTKSDTPAVASTSRLPTNVPSEEPKPTTPNVSQPSTPSEEPKSTAPNVSQPLKLSEEPKSIAPNESEPSTSKTEVLKKTLLKGSLFNNITATFKRVLRYEDPLLQERVKRIVPITKLQVAAVNKLREVQKQMKIIDISKEGHEITAETELTIEDLLLLELLHWFKHDFFEWVDSPKCDFCSSESKFSKLKSSTDKRVSRIEVYKCNVCAKNVEFIRFSDPEPLLYTRRGRCGEWANAFTLICRTFGYDARFIEDKTDHVWTEVWSASRNRWIHLDACEEAMDTPLMYEKGWGKKLSYVFAFSKDEVLDVTWRYTRDQKSVMENRNSCSEISLATFIAKLNEDHLNSPGFSEVRKNYIIKRRLQEWVSMLPAPPGMKKPSEELDDKDYQGRISGSLAWKLLRGEIKNESTKLHKWIVTKSCQNFSLKYNVSTDTYEIAEEIDGTKSISTKSGWENGVEESKGGVFRKIENDWKMVYLARSSESSEGSLKWTFQCSDKQKVVQSVELWASCATFEQGTIQWQVTGFFDETSKQKTIAIEDCTNFKTNELEGASQVTFSVTLGSGTNWQHAQLFRRSSSPDDVHSMYINIELKDI